MITQLSDAVIPEVYSDYTAEDSPERTAFFEAGVVVRNELLDQKANSGGRTVELPYWKDLDASQEPNLSNDDPDDHGEAQKIQSAAQEARIAYLNQGYGAADLVTELAGSDPMQRIRNRFGRYWTRQWQRRLIASSQGILARNIASENSDMVFDAQDRFSRNAYTEAVFTLGDAFGAVRAIAVHSMVFKQMVDNDDIEFIQPSEGEIEEQPTFLGKRVVVDDGLPAQQSGGDVIYTSVLFGEGAFGYGEGTPKTPVELDRSASGGNGGGIETLWERKTWLLHPSGYRFLSGSVAGQSPTLAELRLAANWQRVVDRKNVALAFLKTVEVDSVT